MTARPSGVPGLLVIGEPSYGYYLTWQRPDGTTVPVAPRYPAEYGNTFRRVRDARAAADRLRPLLAWDTDAPAALPNLRGDERTRMGEAITTALTGRTAEQRADPVTHGV